MRAKSAVLAAIVAATTGLSSGCAAGGGLHEEARATRARPAHGLTPTCGAFGIGLPKSFFLPGGDKDGKATLVATAIPGIPLCVAGAVASAPLCILTRSAGPGLLGALVMDFLGTPVIAPFWLIGRLFDGLAGDGTFADVPSRPAPIPSTPQSTTPPIETAAPARTATFGPPMRHVESGEWRIEGDRR